MSIGKKLVTLGMVACLSVASSITAFAAECSVTIFGQKPVSYSEMADNTGEVWSSRYYVIVVGADRIADSDVTFFNGYAGSTSDLNSNNGKLPELQKQGELFLAPVGEGSYADVDESIFGDHLHINANNYDLVQDIQIVYLPESIPVSSLGDLQKYVINASGSTTSTQPTEKTATWASDDKGWWIQYSDGTYLTDSWYQSPTSSLWYFMGSDGYMLTNIRTPDGYYVNSEGVWVQ